MKDYRDGLEMLCMFTCFGVGGWVGGWIILTLYCMYDILLEKGIICSSITCGFSGCLTSENFLCKCS